MVIVVFWFNLYTAGPSIRETVESAALLHQFGPNGWTGIAILDFKVGSNKNNSCAFFF
jgi:hypothetical protein